MSVLLNRNALDPQFWDGPIPTKLSGEEMCLVFLVAPITIGSNFHYLASSGASSGVNTWNVYVPSNGLIGSILFTGGVNTTATSLAGVVTFDQYNLIAVQIRNGVHEIWHCLINGSPTLVGSASVAGQGDWALSGLDIGRRKVIPDNRYLGGELELVMFGSGVSLTGGDMRKISAGLDPTRFIPTPQFYYNPIGTIGQLSGDLIDLSANEADATVNGEPVFSAGPTYPQRIYDLNINVDGGASAITGSEIVAIDEIVVSGVATVRSTNEASSSYCVFVRASSAVLTADDPLFEDLTVNFFAPAGHGARLGTFNGHPIKGGVFRNCSFFGEHSDRTPHLLTLSTGTNATLRDCSFTLGYVGLLLSNIDDCDAQDLYFKDCFGPNLYLKGVVDAHVDRAVFCISATNPQRTNGIVAAVDAEGDECLAGTINDVIIVVQDISQITALAQISAWADGTTPQQVVYSNFKYIIPDSVDLETTDLFIWGGVIGTAPNETFAEWVTHMDQVQNHEIIQYPQTIIDYLVQATPNAIRSYISQDVSGSLISDLIENF